MAKKIIIIGSGFGGLASAIRFQEQKVMMLLCLKNIQT